MSRPAVPRAAGAGGTGYPEAFFETLTRFTGLALPGARVVAVGAERGTAAEPLAARGARVIAVDPDPAACRELRHRRPEIAALATVHTALGLRPAGVDLVAYAQCWHRIGSPRALREAVRVLRPGAALAIWWNLPRPAAQWVADLEAMLSAACGEPVVPSPGRLVELCTTGGLAVRTAALSWTRRLSTDRYLRHVRARARAAGLDDVATTRLVEDVRVDLTRVFPGGWLTQPLRLSLVVGTVQADGAMR